MPGSRSPSDCAQPRRRTPASTVAENRAWRRPSSRRSWSSHATSTCAAEPAFIDSCVPTGIVSRSPIGRSAEATHTRQSPCRRKICADSPVASRRFIRTGPAAAIRRSSPAADASSTSREPSTNRPWMSRPTNRWWASATASRCTVGRARPVALTSWASVAGPASRASRIIAALSTTPTPLGAVVAVSASDSPVPCPPSGVPSGAPDGSMCPDVSMH